MENIEVKKIAGFKCKFCKREFKSVKTLAAHTCEQKRRHIAQNEKQVQLGFRAFQRFYELNSTAIKPKVKTFDEFRLSNYYLAFVKFGKFAKEVNCLRYESFVDWLIKNNLRLDEWAKDGAYELFVRDYVNYELADEAIARSIKFMQRWADKEKEQWHLFFNNVNSNIFVYWIRTGRISPWAVFNCQSGQMALTNLSDEQMGLIADALDPNFWNKRFLNLQEDVNFVKHILVEAGL